MSKKKKIKNTEEQETEKCTKNASEVDVEGTVTEALANAMFRVQLDNGALVLCTIAGKMRKKGTMIRVLPEDRVIVGVSIYDMSRGRIKYRYK